MLFRRREPVTFWERFRLWLWPRRSFSRSLRYMGKRLLRISATPHAVAFGLAIGVFMAATPLLGLHFILALIIAWFARANLAAAAIGTAFANPLTIPLFFGADFVIGTFLLSLFGISGEGPEGIDIHFSNLLDVWNQLSFEDAWVPLIRPLLSGAPVTGFVIGSLAYMGAYWATARFQRSRKEKLAAKVRERLLHDTSVDGALS